MDKDITVTRNREWRSKRGTRAAIEIGESPVQPLALLAGTGISG